MASKSGGGLEFQLTWKMLSPSGPKLANHIGCLISEYGFSINTKDQYLFY